MSFSTKKTTVDFWYPYSWDVLFPQQVARANNIDGWIVGRIADQVDRQTDRQIRQIRLGQIRFDQIEQIDQTGIEWIR